MYSYIINQELARQHQETLMHEATHERLSRHVYKRASTQSAALQQKSLSETDFAAIRRNLRSSLSEWYLELETENVEVVIDTFLWRLRRRLGYSTRESYVKANQR